MDFNNNGNGGMVMPVAPAYGGGYGGGMGFGGDWGWIILLLLCGWGGMGFGGMGGFGGFGGMYEFPWLLNGQNQINANTNAGFDHAATQAAIGDLSSAVTSGIGDVQTALCGGFAGVTAAVNGAANGISQQLYNGTIADMERSYAVQSALQNCCCENRAATADLKYTLASEACATRSANTANTQAILDKLCALELDGVKAQLAAEQRENANLRSDLQYARGQASQIEQTAAIRAGQATTANQLVSELRSCPIPAQPVYGSQPIFTCGGSSCGCGNGFAN